MGSELRGIAHRTSEPTLNLAPVVANRVADGTALGRRGTGILNHGRVASPTGWLMQSFTGLMGLKGVANKGPG